MPATMLSPHFALAEFTVSQTAAREDIDNTPSPEIVDHLRRLAMTLEQVRILLGDKPILISSGYRSPALNAAVGGVPNSAHVTGLAADFIAPGFGSPVVICRFLQSHMAELQIDQLIHEYDSWVHLGLADGRARMMALTIDHNGTRLGFA